MSPSEVTTASAEHHQSAEMDLGPLAWVLEELRKSLDAAVKATRRFVREAEEVKDSDLAALDSSPLRTAKQQLHQSSGALDMVGLPQAALLLRAMESAVQHYVQKPADCTEAVVQTLEKASFALLEYLETVLAGKRVSAVALFPQYRDVNALYGNEAKVHPADLWPVERRLRDPQLPHQTAALQYSPQVRKVLDAAVLHIIKGTDIQSASGRMRDISLGFAQGQADAALRIFWKVSAAYFDAMAHGLLKIDVYTKRVASRILMLCASMAKGEQVAPERLLQDMLFFCAQASAHADAQEAEILILVCRAFELPASAAVDYEHACFGRFDPALLAQARKRIAAATETWSALAGGDRNKIKPAVDQFTLVCDSLNKLHPASQCLSRVLMQVMQSVAQKAEPPGPAIAMEVATAVLYLQAAFASLDMADEAMTAHAQTLAKRLEGVLSGGEPQPLEPWMEQLYRQVSDQQTMGSVVGELRGTLAEAEKQLDQFFRNPADTSVLASVGAHLSQMRGVLSVLGLDQASQAMVRMRQNVERLQSEQLSEAEQQQLFEKMGNSMGALGFLIDMLSYQRNMARKLYEFDEEAGELKLLMGRHAAKPHAAHSVEPMAAPMSKNATAADVVSVSEVKAAVQPDSLQTEAASSEESASQSVRADEVSAAEVPLSVSALSQDAVEDVAASAPQLAASDASSPASVAKSEPVASPALQVEHEDSDDELLGIFLEEAREVVTNGLAALDALSQDPADLSEQTTLRRAFHTLKGSSRMVGLDDFGEAGWAMEQMLNAWLAEQKAMPEHMRVLAAQALHGFAQWADAIERSAAQEWQSAPFRASADAMRLHSVYTPLDMDAVRGACASAQVEAPVAAIDSAQIEVAESLQLQAAEAATLGDAPVLSQQIGHVERPRAEALDTSSLGMNAPLLSDVHGKVKPDDSGMTALSLDELSQTVAPDSLSLDFDFSTLPQISEATDTAQASELLSDGDLSGEPPQAGEASMDEFEALLQATGDGISAPILPPSKAPAQIPPPVFPASPEEIPLLGAEVQDQLPVEDVLQVSSEPIDEIMVGVELDPIEIPAAAPITPQELVPAEPEAEPSNIKQVGDLSIPLPLFNVYLSEAEGWSFRLLDALTGWQENVALPQPESVVAWAHSLAGSSATVGFKELSGLARALEHALEHVQPQECGVAEQVSVFVQAAEEIRSMLHQFAAGVLSSAPITTLDKLHQILDTELLPATAQEREDAKSHAEERGAGASSVVPPPMLLDDAIAQAMALDESQDDDIDVFDVIDPDLFPIFEEEAIELLPTLGGAMREWANHPTRLEARSILLRALHTLKGSARLAGAMRLGEMAHRLESALEELDVETVTTEQIEPLFGRLDAIEAGFNVLRAVGEQVEAESLRVEQEVAPASQPDEVAQEIPLVPAGESAKAAVAPVSPVAAPLLAPEPYRPAPVHVLRQGAQQTVRVRSLLLDRLINEAGEVMIARSRLDARMGSIKNSLGDLTNNLERLRQQLRDIEVQAESQMQSRMQLSKEAGMDFDPLEFDRFTRVQELTRMMAESVNDVATVQRNLMRDVAGAEDDLIAQGRQARELQRDLLRTRMVEFDSISERLYAVVRQTSKETGKQVKLGLSGGTIEMDRGVLERMVPAFEHLLRNCVDHGIEKPEVRTAAGKNATGTITVHVQQEGNDVAVSFQDDGAGLNVARIRDKALEQGLISENEVVDIARAAQLVFTPGFTTAQQLTGVSGRGIGMDVVRSEVQALGGRIETQSEPSKGSSFRLVLPLTTAVTQVVMLRVGDFSVGVPASLVEVVRRISLSELESAYRTGELDDGIEHIPFYWAGAVWSQSPRSVEQGVGKTRPVVIFRSASQRIALHVDEVLGHQEVVVKNLGPQMSRLPGLAGMSVLASGAVVLIYNPVALTSVYGDKIREMGMGLPALLDEQTAKQIQRDTVPTEPVSGIVAASQAPLVMVVDDSITVRRVSQRLLQREGYRVVTAADGLQALEKLQDEIPCVVLSDIEMPRMDGFDLLRNIRSDERFQHLPVIMITSRIAQKHREHAMELGANHYLGKPYSDEELMALVHHYAVGKPLPQAQE